MPYLRLLGSACLENDHGSLSGPVVQRHRLALLALLAVAHPRGLSREKLLAYLWPQKDVDRARNLLNQAVHHVRKALGSGAVVSSGGDLLLDPAVLPSDLAAFEEAADAGRWREAVELYGGPFMDGFHLGEATEFEKWLDRERLRVADRYRQALEALAEAAEAEGDWSQAVGWWKRRANEERLNSRVTRRLMEAFAAEGNVSGALAQARVHERLLQEELGVPLPEEVRSLVDDLAERGGLGPTAGGRESVPPAVRSESPPPSERSEPPAVPGRGGSPPEAEREAGGERWKVAEQEERAEQKEGAEREEGAGQKESATAPEADGAASRSPGSLASAPDEAPAHPPGSPASASEGTEAHPAGRRASASDEAEEAPGEPRGEGNDGGGKEVRSVPPRATVLGGALALAVVGVAGTGWLLGGGDGGPDGAAQPGAGDPPRSIVVLPFENLGPAEEQYFADGVTEELTVRLASVSGLAVIARTSALRYQNTGMDIREIGAELGVDYALRGTVRWENRTDGSSRVRVTPRLVRTADGTQIWADTYERDLAEIFAVQVEIAERVVRALDPSLMAMEEDALERPRTDDLEAYDHYLQGNAYVARQFSAEAARAGIAQYERAVALDPGFAEAWRRLIQTRLWLSWVFADEEQGLQAREDLERLEEVGADGPEVRLGRAWYLFYGERRYEEALREARAVRRSRPGDEEVIRLVGALEQRVGPWEEGLATMKEALELNPRDAELAFFLGHAYRWMGRYDEAERYYQRAIALAPDMGFAYGTLDALHLARGDTLRAREARSRARERGADAWQGGRPELHGRDFADAAERIRAHPAGRQNARMYRYDALADAYGRAGDDGRRTLYADSLLALATEVAPESWDRPREPAANLGWVFTGLARIHLGDPDRGLEDVRRGLEMEEPFEDPVVGSLVQEAAARAFVRAGRHDEAVELLESVRSVPALVSGHDLRHDPEWDPLREDPRFQRLLVDPGPTP